MSKRIVESYKKKLAAEEGYTVSRERGLRGLGQMAKSFRDRPAQFPVYQPGFDTGYLDQLGAVATPRRVDAPPPANVTTLPVRRSFVG